MGQNRGRIPSSIKKYEEEKMESDNFNRWEMGQDKPILIRLLLLSGLFSILIKRSYENETQSN